MESEKDQELAGSQTLKLSSGLADDRDVGEVSKSHIDNCEEASWHLRPCPPTQERLHVSMTLSAVIQRLPSVLRSLGPAEVEIHGCHVAATIFQDYLPHEIEVHIHDGFSRVGSTIQLCEAGVPDPVRFRAVVRVVAKALGADVQYPNALEFIDESWSEDGDHDDEVWKQHIDHAARRVVDRDTSTSSREELLQMLASWSDRSVTAMTMMAKTLAAPLGIYLSSMILQLPGTLHRSSVRSMYPYAVLLKNATASPAGAEVQHECLISMIRCAVARPEVALLVKQELQEALDKLSTFGSSEGYAMEPWQRQSGNEEELLRKSHFHT